MSPAEEWSKMMAARRLSVGDAMNATARAGSAVALARAQLERVPDAEKIAALAALDEAKRRLELAQAEEAQAYRAWNRWLEYPRRGR